MACCAGYDREFSARRAMRALRRYQRGKISDTTRLLADAIAARDVEGATMLDIGGGIGVLQHLLLERGVAKACGVEASPGYDAAVKLAAESRGLDGRIEYLEGDFVALAPDLDAADIVTLDRVICGYPDMPALVGLSAARARRCYGVVFPRDLWWVHLWSHAENVFHWLRRCEFRVFAHSPVAIDETIRREGLLPCFDADRGPWRVVLYERIAA